MRQKTHKRSRMIGTSVAASAVLLIGGGGLVVMNANANANDSTRAGASRWQAATIDCPEVGDQLREVPRQSRREVDRNLAQLDNQVADAYKRLKASSSASDQEFVEGSILKPLRDRRKTTITRIANSIGRYTKRPANLERLSQCEAVEDTTPDGEGEEVLDQDAPEEQNDGGQDAGQQDGGQQDAGQEDGGQEDAGQNGGGQAGFGPSPEDFVDITQVEPNVAEPEQQEGASTGTFSSACGVNENKNRNSDNVIVAPGVTNGAHHQHDYVGNQEVDAFSTNDSLAAADTSCENEEDQSTYYWPVIRIQNGQDDEDVNAPGGGQDGNFGQIQQAVSATQTFVGSPVGDVVAMPRFLRIITGDAKAFTNGVANANSSWSCTGFEDRQLTDKYPLCPEGSQVVRTFKFQSCWDGQNIDSANHRTHVAFANENGECAEGFQAIPQLVQKLTYNLPADQVFAVDGFPEQLHKPITDHSDFINVMSDGLMQRAVECINNGEDCT